MGSAQPTWHRRAPQDAHGPMGRGSPLGRRSPWERRSHGIWCMGRRVRRSRPASFLAQGRLGIPAVWGSPRPLVAQDYHSPYEAALGRSPSIRAQVSSSLAGPAIDIAGACVAAQRSARRVPRRQVPWDDADGARAWHGREAPSHLRARARVIVAGVPVPRGSSESRISHRMEVSRVARLRFGCRRPYDSASELLRTKERRLNTCSKKSGP